MAQTVTTWMGKLGWIYRCQSASVQADLSVEIKAFYVGYHHYDIPKDFDIGGALKV